MAAPIVYVLSGAAVTFAGLAALGAVLGRRAASAADSSISLDTPGMLEGSAAWQSSEIDRAVSFSAPTLIEIYADCLMNAQEMHSDLNPDPSAEAVVGAWAAAIAVLFNWTEYKPTVAYVMHEAGIGPLVRVIDAIIVGGTQQALSNAARLAGIEGVVDPMDRLDPFFEMMHDANVAEWEADEEGEDD